MNIQEAIEAMKEGKVCKAKSSYQLITLVKLPGDKYIFYARWDDDENWDVFGSILTNYLLEEWEVVEAQAKE